MSIWSNLRPRLRLLRTALTRRFVYRDLVAMATEYGIEYHDVRGDIEPFEFVRDMTGSSTGGVPDFSRMIGPAAAFTPPHAPANFNSEPSVGRFLGQLVYHKNARVVVELGCFVGWTSAHLALALEARGGTGRIWCVDFMPEYLDVTMANLRRMNLDTLVTPVQGLSLAPAVLQALPSNIDVLFLDTSHGYPATRDEVLAYAPRLAPGGCLVLHDSLSAVGVRRSLRELADRFTRFTFATEEGNGLTVLVPCRKP